MHLEKFYSMKDPKNIYNPLSDELKAIIYKKPIVVEKKHYFYLPLNISPRGLRTRSELLEMPPEYRKVNRHHILDKQLFTYFYKYAPYLVCDVYRDEHTFLHTILAKAKTESDFYHYEEVLKSLYPSLNMPVAQIYIDRIHSL